MQHRATKISEHRRRPGNNQLSNSRSDRRRYFRYRTVGHFIFLFFLLAYSFSSSATVNLHHSQISTRIGDKAVTSALIDTNGYLWIGTQRGLYFFNGAESKFFSTRNTGQFGIPASDIRGISEYIDGRIVLATYGAGLAISNENQDHFFSVSDKGKENTAYLTELHNGRGRGIWATTNSELLYKNDISIELESLKETIPEIKGPQGPWVLTDQEGGELLVSAGSEVWALEEDSLKIRGIFSSNLHGMISAVLDKNKFFQCIEWYLVLIRVA